LNTKKQLVPTNANFALDIHLQALSKQWASSSSEVVYVIVTSSGVGAQFAAPGPSTKCRPLVGAVVLYL